MKLVICEKPSVGAGVAAALGVREKKDGYIEGNGYVISWCIGHLVGLAEAAAYGEQYRKWSYDSLPILPQEWQYTVAADKGKQFKILKDLMQRSDVSEVVNACDAGREGELIFRFVYHQAGCKKPFTRLWISSMETDAIKSGFDNLKDGRRYDALYHSALCRAKADWLIGINATRLFSCLYGKTLNVGRVQTPTLKMLVDRDAAIMNFKKEKYYHVRLMLPGAEAASAKICAADEAGKLKAACEASAAVCTSLTRENKTAIPPKLFDLTSLQREANRIYGYTAIQLTKPGSSVANIDAKKYFLHNLFAAMLVPSGNDAAYVVADYCGSILSPQAKNSQERINVFMEHLNNYLQNQGYENTILYDPSGYDVNALTTVSDLKSVSTHLLEKQWFRDIVSKSNYTATLPDGSTQTWRNTNTFLDQTSEYYNENVKGIKTGSLSNDYNLVVLYQQHGKEFLICSLGSQSDSSRYDDVNYILKTIDESDYLTK